jgi:hypothetical protein
VIAHIFTLNLLNITKYTEESFKKFQFLSKKVWQQDFFLLSFDHSKPVFYLFIRIHIFQRGLPIIHALCIVVRINRTRKIFHSSGIICHAHLRALVVCDELWMVNIYFSNKYIFALALAYWPGHAERAAPLACQPVASGIVLARWSRADNVASGIGYGSAVALTTELSMQPVIYGDKTLPWNIIAIQFKRNK